MTEEDKNEKEQRPEDYITDESGKIKYLRVEYCDLDYELFLLNLEVNGMIDGLIEIKEKLESIEERIDTEVEKRDDEE